MNKSKSELMKFHHPGVPFDTALPQDFVDECQRCGFDPRPEVVWAYPAMHHLFGIPMGVTIKATAKLRLVAAIQECGD